MSDSRQSPPGKGLPSLDDLSPELLSRSTVLLRVDFNVPLDGSTIVDDTRIREALPTLRELIDADSRVVVASHCGRPKGQRVPELSLAPAAERLSELLEVPVAFAQDCIGQTREAAQDNLRSGEVLVLQNLRFHAGEENDDEVFAKALARGCDLYVNDAFGCAHRAHASVSAVTHSFDRKAAGRLLLEEVRVLSGLLGNPKRPFLAILGGAKIESKIDTLRNLVEVVDELLLGGGMANTFLASQGHDMARSLFESERLEAAREILDRARERRISVRLPSDVVVTDELGRADRRLETTTVDAVPDWGMAVDIGSRTRAVFEGAIAGAGTLFWNGPMGVFESPGLEHGSYDVARAVGACPGFTVIGGGETAAVANQAGVTTIDHVSTGGGASLELLAGAVLPGVEALRH